ncbi:MAG: transposase, partial [Prochlorotrichaceae cyanobacterium]
DYFLNSLFFCLDIGEYLKHHLTSGITEGINTKIKLIKRRSYGLPEFSHLRLMLLACFET